MRFKLLGHSGLRVSELCLGAMTFGEEWGWGASKDESRKVFDCFVNAGGNFIDTANYYTNGTSEKFLGEFVGDRREQFVIATKYSLNMRELDANGGGNHRKNMVQSLEASLKRLKMDYVDLYWLHIWDCMTPAEEVMRALDDLIRAGKILYIGISDTPAWIISQANTLAELRGWTQFAALQTQYSLVERCSERDLLPMTQAFDMAVTVWGALGSGVLTGKYSRQKEAHPKDARLTTSEFGKERLVERNYKIAEEVVAVAKELGCSPSQVALAWVRQQKRGGVLIPIIGARTVAQLEDNLGCIKVILSPAHLQRLDAVSHVELGFPHEFIAKGKHLIFGKMHETIDNHHPRG